MNSLSEMLTRLRTRTAATPPTVWGTALAVLALAALVLFWPSAPTETPSTSTSSTTASFPAYRLCAGGDCLEVPDDDVHTMSVTAVVDGDTIRVSADPSSGAEETVRLVGVNSPERGECFAREAAVELSSLLSPDGSEVEVVYPPGLSEDESLDLFGRRLAYVARDRGSVFVNAELLEAGAADAVPYDGHDLEDGFDSLASGAKEDGVGRWGPDCASPVDGISLLQAQPSGDPDPLDEYVVVGLDADAAGPLDLEGFILADAASHRLVLPSVTLDPGDSIRVVSGCDLSAPLADPSAEDELSDDEPSGGEDPDDPEEAAGPDGETTAEPDASPEPDSATRVGDGVVFWCADGPVWNDSGDRVSLQDPDGREVSSLEY